MSFEFLKSRCRECWFSIRSRRYWAVIAAVGFVTVLGCLTVLGAEFVPRAQAQAGRSGVQMAPHRAVYDISLVQADAGSGISGMSGRMVYELSGNACDGYTQKMRFVTRIIDRSGVAQVNDLRSASWESGAAERLRFDQSQYRNDDLTDKTKGEAGRDGDFRAPIDVHLVKPRKKEFRLKGDVYFPMQHSLAIIKAAKAGKRLFTAHVYDGSDMGEKVFMASASIGKELPAGTLVIPSAVNSALEGKGLAAWPVSISFFEPGGEHQDAVPAYELSFRFMENGISTRLFIDYGEFSVRGKLRELKLLARSECSSPRRSN